jgi:hypothetical protein
MATRHTTTRSTTALNQLVATETQRRRRGHQFYPNAGTWSRMPRTHDDGIAGADACVVAHYFGGPMDLWVTGMDDDGLVYGFVCMAHMPESAAWGLSSAPELEAINDRGLVIIERDLYWSPTRAGDIQEIVATGGAFS